MYGGDSEELEHRIIIELIVGLAHRVKHNAFDGTIKLIEGVPTTEPSTKPGEFTSLSHPV
jgi:hypothetical protein